MLLVAGFVSCTKTEYITITPEEEEPDTSTYTIMMYGCGGGNLDSSMVMNIQEALLAGATERVNFTGQVKFSERYHEDDTLAGTQRFVVGEAGDIWYTPVEVLDSDLKLYDPQKLTDFINWSKQQRQQTSISSSSGIMVAHGCLTMTIEVIVVLLSLMICMAMSV